MALKSKQILSILGYQIDMKGNVLSGSSQLAIISLEKEPDGGVLRVHGTDDQFFYGGDPLLWEKELMFPAKITGRYVYFRGPSETLRVKSEDFIENSLKAFFEFTKISGKTLAG